MRNLGVKFSASYAVFSEEINIPCPATNHPSDESAFHVLCSVDVYPCDVLGRILIISNARAMKYCIHSV